MRNNKCMKINLKNKQTPLDIYAVWENKSRNNSKHSSCFQDEKLEDSKLCFLLDFLLCFASSGGAIYLVRLHIIYYRTSIRKIISKNNWCS